MYRRIAPLALLMALATPAAADTLTLQPQAVPDLKAVYARIEARDRLPARARLGGTLMTLTVAEGDLVTQGDVLAEIVDEKLGFQLSAIDAQITAATAQLDNATTELQRGEGLLQQGRDHHPTAGRAAHAV
jgi:multidrug efflux pump subunit AcrA (membrane-fusion protein)